LKYAAILAKGDKLGKSLIPNEFGITGGIASVVGMQLDGILVRDDSAMMRDAD